MDIAIGTAFGLSRHDSMEECGLVKWLHNSAQLAAALLPRAQVVVWTNAAGAAFTLTACPSCGARIIFFDAALLAAVDAWATAADPPGEETWRGAGENRHSLPLRTSFGSRAALLKWQAVRHVEYRLIFLTDADVDIYGGPGAVGRSAAWQAAAQRAWSEGVERLLASHIELVASADHESPVNTGVLLIRPRVATYKRGLQALSRLRFNYTHGFEGRGTPCEVLGPLTIQHSKRSWAVRRCSWNFVGGNADQGLFTYVYGGLRGTLAFAGLKGYSVVHHWSHFKPWLMRSRRWCLRWFDFLDRLDVAANRSRCAADLWLRRRRVEALNASDVRVRCAGDTPLVFPP
tara:strand:+ start:54 stop:1091 length:1038 start_codon:yes stop_codon:yes gene_type:complete